MNEWQERCSGQWRRLGKKRTLVKGSQVAKPKKEIRGYRHADPREPQRVGVPEVRRGVLPKDLVSIHGERQRPEGEQGKHGSHDEEEPPCFDNRVA